MSRTSSDEKRWYEFISLSLFLGLVAAIGALIFFGWLTDEVLEGDSRQFDETTRAAVHQLASPALTMIMRGFSFVGSTLALAVLTILVIVQLAMKKLGREATKEKPRMIIVSAG